MLLLISSVKLIAEIALLSLLGQWILGLLAGQKREQNLFYQVLQVLTRPELFRRATELRRLMQECADQPWACA